MEQVGVQMIERTTQDSIKESLLKAISYEEYRALVTQLASEGKATGPVQTAALANYTQLNDRRMKRWDKTLKFDAAVVDKIASVEKKMTWLVLTESWCGDASPALPVLHKIAALNQNISLKIVLRDENIELMNRFLTNGGMSIPKLIAFDEHNEVFADWGPRSKAATKLVDAYKAEHGKLTPAFKEELQVWYNKDKGQSILKDIVEDVLAVSL